MANLSKNETPPASINFHFPVATGNRLDVLTCALFMSAKDKTVADIAQIGNPPKNPFYEELIIQALTAEWKGSDVLLKLYQDTDVSSLSFYQKQALYLDFLTNPPDKTIFGKYSSIAKDLQNCRNQVLVGLVAKAATRNIAEIYDLLSDFSKAFSIFTGKTPN